MYYVKFKEEQFLVSEDELPSMVKILTRSNVTEFHIKQYHIESQVIE